MWHLNLWDGIRETPGRIIVITSNHYDQLDPALIRPGRIDMTYEFKKVAATSFHRLKKSILNV